jgi:hypothetical protein
MTGCQRFVGDSVEERYCRKKDKNCVVVLLVRGQDKTERFS